jgi:hypothetical protein
MHHPNSLRPKRLRPAVITAALLSVIVSGCAEQLPIAPEIAHVLPTAPVARSTAATFDRYFLAWSQGHSATPIQTQNFSLDARQERQWGWWADEAVRSFARANPGRLYIVGDEPDQYCMAPSEYAQMYHDFVAGVREVDPTAQFSPAGFAEPNYKCCPLPDDTPWSCWYEKHSNGFAEQFYAAYVARYGVAPTVHEWRFHDFGLRFGVGDMNGWWQRINTLAAWSVDHGANMVLGAWGFHSWRESDAAYQEHLKQAMGRMLAYSRINGAVYWSYEQWAGEINYLQNPDGSLTAAGQTYANPLTDVPVNLRIAGSPEGLAKLRWSNTTSAWGAEVEYWVLPAGSNTFVYHSTQHVPALGAVETPVAAINNATMVKARVRYYNKYGTAPWSSFSSAVSVAETGDGGLQKRPLVCTLPMC